MSGSFHRLATFLLLVVVTSTASAEADPVIWEFQLERAERRLAQAEAELTFRKRVHDWTQGLPVSEELGRLGIVSGRDRFRDDRRSVLGEIDRSRLAIEFAQLEVDMRTLDLEEMRVANTLPKVDLYARLIEERDFVGERQQRRLEVLKAEESFFRDRLHAQQMLHDQRALPVRDLNATSIAVTDVAALIEELELQINLRRLHLDDNLPDDAQWLLEEAELRRRRLPVAARLADARAQLERINPLTARGFAGQLDLDEIDSRVRSLRDELDLIDLEQALYEYRLAQWRAQMNK